MNEVLKFVTPYGNLERNAKKFCVFCKNNSILRPILVNYWFERPFFSSPKRAQDKHKKNWRAQAKLLDVLSYDIMRKARKKVKNF